MTMKSTAGLGLDQVMTGEPGGMGIAEASDAVEMHPQTLRKYERAGLLRPARLPGGSRTYSSADIRRLELLRYLADERGVNVAGMVLALSIRDQVLELLFEIESAENSTAASRLATNGLRELLAQFQRRPG